MTFGCPLRGLLAVPFRLVESIGRGVGLLDGDERAQSTASTNGTHERLDELLHAQGRTNDLLARLLSDLVVENRRARDSASLQVTGGDGVRRELERLASAQEQTNEIVGALIEGLAELTRLQTPARVVDDSPRLERIIAAQTRMNELLELALRAGFEDDERARRH
jgi:hypothetical protein